MINSLLSLVPRLRSRVTADVAIALSSVALFHLVSIATGRLADNDGFGWDGASYARMVTDSLDLGSPNTQTRPLLLLLTRIPYAMGLDVYHSFQWLNYVYAFGFYLASSLVLARSGLAWPGRAILVANLALCIATSRMFAFYPVLIDLGALALITLAFHLSAIDRHRLAGAVCVLATASREFGVAAALYGMHRAFRQRRGWRDVASYVPSLVTIALIRWQVATALEESNRPGPLSIGDAIGNLAFWASPGFLAGFAYFTMTVFGGISLLLLLRSRWCFARLRAEPELASFLLVVVAATVAGSADVWRYLVFASPVALVLAGTYLKDLGRDLQRRSLIAVIAVTLLTQRPLELMDRGKYFMDWFPLYYVLRMIDPVDSVLPVWIPRLLALALVMPALYYAAIPLGPSRAARGWRREILPALVLIVVAIWPIRQQLQATGPAMLEPAARIRVNWELENRRLLDGEIPLWNPKQFGGQSHLADPETLTLYPPHLILRFVPIRVFFPISFALHAALAGWGAYLVARHLRVPRLASTGAATAIMLGGVFAQVADPSSSDAQRLAWLPLALALAMRSTGRGGAMPQPALVVIGAISLLSGSIRGAMFVASIVAGWYLFTAIVPGATSRRSRLLPQFAALTALSLGLAAVVLVPAAELRASAGVAGGLSYDEPGVESWHQKTAKPVPPDSSFVAALAPLEGRRTLSACQEAVDPGQLSMLGIPTVGGYGGVLLADYAWFTNFTSTTYPERHRMRFYSGLEGAGREPTRADLMRFLDVEYLLTCAPPDQPGWERIGEVGGAGVYRNLNPLGRAVWTCAPERVGSEELEYRLDRFRYDDTLVLRQQTPLINVRWAPGVRDEERARAETTLHLLRDRFLGDRTWRYELHDSSAENAMAILTSPAVEDTHGLDRASGVLVGERTPAFSDEKREWLIGLTECADTRPAVVLDKDRPDGRVVAQVDAPRDGIVLFSEPYHPQRGAWVDGRRVAPLKVNVTFTGVPVTAGSHRVEIGHTRLSLAIGFGLSAVALATWFAGERRYRRTSGKGRS